MGGAGAERVGVGCTVVVEGDTSSGSLLMTVAMLGGLDWRGRGFGMG